MVALFGVTLFVSAFLLFGLQPMVGKALLPLFGGTASVWNLCLVFFQAALLAGYGYSHVLTAGIRRQSRPLLWQGLVHFTLIVMALLLLPPQVPQSLLEEMATRAANGASLTVVLEAVFLWVGLPFVVLSAT